MSSYFTFDLSRMTSRTRAASPDSIQLLIQKHDSVDNELEAIDVRLDRLRALKNSICQKATQRELEATRQEVLHEKKNVVQSIQALRKRIASGSPDSSSSSSSSHASASAITRQAEESKYRHQLQKLQERLKALHPLIEQIDLEFERRYVRLLQSVYPQASKQQLAHWAQEEEDPQARLQQFYEADRKQQEQLQLHPPVSMHLEDTVHALEQRHAEIQKLNRDVLELFELFKDLSVLVDLQQESLDVIDNHIAHARDHVDRGEVELDSAADYQKKARKRRCCLLFIVLIVLGVLMLSLGLLSKL